MVTEDGWLKAVFRFWKFGKFSWLPGSWLGSFCLFCWIFFVEVF